MAVDHQTVLDVVRLAAQGRLPLRVDVLAVVGVNGSQERLIGQRRPLGQAEDPMILVGPREDIAAHVQTPAADLPHGLGSVQIRLALAERRERLLGLLAGGDGVVHQVERSAARLTQRRLGLFSVGDVLHDTTHPARAPTGIPAVASGGPYPADLTIHTPDAALEAPVAAGGRRRAKLRIHRRAVLREHVFQEHLVGPLREQLLVAENAVVFQRPIGGVIHQIEVPRAGVAGFQRKAQAVLARVHRRLGFLDVLDVRVAAEPLDDLARVVAQGDGESAKPPINAIISAQAELDGEIVAAGCGGLPDGDRAVAVVGVELLQPAITELRGFGDAGVVDPLRTEVVARPVGAAGPNKLRQGLHDLPEPLLARAHRLLGPLALGDVGGDADEPFQIAGGVEHGPADFLHHHDAAVAADDAVFDRVGVGGGRQFAKRLRKPCTVVRVDALEEMLPRVVDGFVAGELEDRLATGGALHPVGGRFPVKSERAAHAQGLLHPFLAGAQGRFGLFQLADVAPGHDGPDDGSGLVPQRRGVAEQG